jgi:hypothetical protein
LASLFGKGTGKMRVMRAFFLSKDLDEPDPDPERPAEADAGPILSDV